MTGLLTIESSRLNSSPSSVMGAPATANAASGSPSKFYINRTNLAPYYSIDSSDGELHVSMQFHRLIFHDGPDNTSPTIGESRIPFFSRKSFVGLGDPENPQAMQWEDLASPGPGLCRWRWAMTCGKTGERVNLQWKRSTRCSGAPQAKSWVEAWVKGKSRARSYELCTESGELIAVFISDLNFQTCGVLQINRPYGRSFDLMVCMTCLTLYEKARRMMWTTLYKE